MFSMRLIIGIIFLLLINVKYSLANHKFTCNHFTEKYEKKFSLPNKLLTSISLVESGKKVGDKFTSWPWTLNVDGKSKFFESKDQTLSFLKSNYKKKKNIDVGCMQISLKYHFKNFKNLEHALDPESNVRYGAKFLKSLYKRHRTWNEAISRYHSSNIPKKNKYLEKVKHYWSELRQKKKYIEIGNLRKKRDEKIEYYREILSKNKYSNKI